ncbi:hypothetical protein MA20_48730 [Bradyrhizobium japonicum]|uniref:Calcineurin-like phosphoesterase domain-containing protein n=1 Tax=Bradyrhizobium japonicum TaxID=375 RepID=A0A0A3XE41_BRAJP|nr:metallophosphoesterase family protein [Bradyrhizobium japonicum]KGT72697.1 hypothetical protein MA20_48730 [Bradyrhizobium japonicum]
MKRSLVISDIHGELDKFCRLLVQADYQPEKDQLILLGDYIDRGPDPKGVVEKIMQLKQQGAIVLKGNHDDWMTKAFERDPLIVAKWLRNGGDKTLHSYDHPAQYPDDGMEEYIQQAAGSIAELKTASAIVAEHLDFLAGLDYYHQTDEFIFVHGGVHPTTPLAETDPSVLIWIRDEFHKGYKGEKTVVFGHTTTNNLHGCDSFEVYFGQNNIIGIDGGAVFGGRLNCLELPSKKVYYVE